LTGEEDGTLLHHGLRGRVG